MTCGESRLRCASRPWPVYCAARYRGCCSTPHLTHPGDLVFEHACKMGLEGIVSKRLGSVYRSGRSPDWLKFKNPDAPAVRREAEEDWNRSRRGRGDHDHN